VYLCSNGNKSKFSKFGVDLFLIGKFKKDYIVKKIAEMKKERGIEEKSTKRILQNNSTTLYQNT
jgi:predicted metal-dependent phosphotriesterase family hydrolase